MTRRTRSTGGPAYLLASLAGALGTVVGFLIGFQGLAGTEAGAAPAALGAFAIVVAVGAGIHESDLRWKTWRSLGLGTAALAVEPMFAMYPWAGYVVIGVAVLALLTYFFPDL